eukprot:gene14817-10595_t
MSTNKDQKKIISKKAKKEKEKKAIEESTFGLKNKNKSKKVQQFISRVEKSVKHSGDGLERERAKELKKEAKLAKALQEEQMRLLFQEAIGNQFEKLAKKRAEMEARVKAEQSKKKGGKGLSVLSGKELFSYNASLFVDDESAFDTTNDTTLETEMKELQRREEEKIAEETRRAQEEQERLMAAQTLEVESRRYREDARRQAATAADRVLLTFNGVSINKVVFEDDEDEDLTLFTDEVFVPDVRRVYKDCAGDLSKMFERLNLTA